ncbi:MAG: hypothetical protein ACMG6H_05915 [Acidobacteriota bacterium]
MIDRKIQDRVVELLRLDVPMRMSRLGSTDSQDVSVAMTELDNLLPGTERSSQPR